MRKARVKDILAARRGSPVFYGVPDHGEARGARCSYGTGQARPLQIRGFLVRQDAVANPGGWSVESNVSDQRFPKPDSDKEQNEVNL